MTRTPPQLPLAAHPISIDLQPCPDSIDILFSGVFLVSDLLQLPLWRLLSTSTIVLLYNTYFSSIASYEPTAPIARRLRCDGIDADYPDTNLDWTSPCFHPTALELLLSLRRHTRSHRKRSHHIISHPVTLYTLLSRHFAFPSYLPDAKSRRQLMS